MSKVARFFMTAIVFAVAIAGSISPASAQTQVTVLHNPGSSYTPLFVAKDQGFFAKRGLDVTLTTIVNQGATLGTINSGGAQFAATTMLGLLQAQQSGIELTIVAGTGVSVGGTTTLSDMLVRNESDINSAKDLVGKTIAVPGLNEYFHVLTKRWLKDNGVDPTSVKFVEISLPQMGDALKSGQIDVALTIAPYSTRIKNSFGRVLVNFDSILPPKTLASVYISSRGWAESHREAVKAYADGLNEAVAYIKGNDGSARTSVADHLKLPAEAVATMPFPVFEVTVTPEQVAFWIKLAKDQGLLPENSKITPEGVIFH